LDGGAVRPLPVVADSRRLCDKKKSNF